MAEKATPGKSETPHKLTYKPSAGSSAGGGGGGGDGDGGAAPRPAPQPEPSSQRPPSPPPPDDDDDDDDDEVCACSSFTRVSWGSGRWQVLDFLSRCAQFLGDSFSRSDRRRGLLDWVGRRLILGRTRSRFD